MKKVFLALFMLCVCSYFAQAQNKQGSNSSKGAKDKTLPGVMAQQIVKNMVRVPGGYFWMGTAGNSKKETLKHASPRHYVNVTDFYICKYEVTQEEYEAIMGASANHSAVKGKDLPVTNVSWNEAQQFCKMLHSLTGQNFQLPTEAQWEFAARGGEWVNTDNALYSGSGKLSEIASCWYNTEFYFKNGSDSRKARKAMEEGHAAITGSYKEKLEKTEKWDAEHGLKPRTRSWVKANIKPNHLGIYDMSGNVSEWCYDGYENHYQSGNQVNPKVSKGDARVYRGGSYLTSTEVESEYENMALVYNRESTHGTAKDALGRPGKKTLGFRVAIWIKQK